MSTGSNAWRPTLLPVYYQTNFHSSIHISLRHQNSTPTPEKKTAKAPTSSHTPTFQHKPPGAVLTLTETRASILHMAQLNTAMPLLPGATFHITSQSMSSFSSGPLAFSFGLCGLKVGLLRLNPINPMYRSNRGRKPGSYPSSTWSTFNSPDLPSGPAGGRCVLSHWAAAG